MTSASNTSEPLLSLKNLSVQFRTGSGVVRAVDDVSYELNPGETLGVVGESGSGKSVTVMSLMRLLPEASRPTVTGEALFGGRDLLTLSNRELRAVRGSGIALVPQDPMTCLDPVFKVGKQIVEALRAHDQKSRYSALRTRAIELLEMVGISQPERRFDQYPHQFSGGMRQRAMIAMAMANKPKLLIADEPTTALDVTIQAQILELLKEMQREMSIGIVLITHDLRLVSEMADKVVVMYAGHVVERGDGRTVFDNPQHPYTLGLMSSLPQASGSDRWLRPIPGNPPSLANTPSGCPFHPRCALANDRAECRTSLPVLRAVAGADHRSACHFTDELTPQKQAELTSARRATA